ncbi:MAG: outer-membrane lipoprotein carrier protein LolA, partial [Muribaculaceae bacterium]|nr:outer-membrane lipoprotein carrier protein LolA [Muribaculaceae bacterium]
VYKADGCITASYSATTQQGTNIGTIVMNGSKFRILSPEYKTWYNGKTQWTYSTVTDEVNITTPTQAELQTINPYAAAQSLRANFNVAQSKAKSGYCLVLTPKNKNNSFKSVTLLISPSFRLTNATFKTQNTKYEIKLTNYKTQTKQADSIFSFNKALVPEDTEIVDLR